MRSILRKCEDCGKYTLKDICSCGKKTMVPIPPRFSPQDRFGEYRRKLKEIHGKEKMV
ncbi:MAG: RNA-protein complex protein Nop10 [Thermoplasmata archaeon]|nr:MAG: RNA-protein complex protein Nop10 [Thermoplasmata archaeon]